MMKIIFALTLSVMILAGCGKTAKIPGKNAANDDVSKKVAEHNASIETPGETVKDTENKIEDNGDSSEFVSEESIKSMITMLVVGSSDEDIRKFEKEFDDGKWKYDVEVIYGGMEYEFEFDAKTGEVLSFDSESVFD